jgi:guanine deaminase
MNMARSQAWRARILHCTGEPQAAKHGELPPEVEYFEDGLLVVEDDRIAVVGPASSLLDQLGPDVPVHDQRDKLLLPGFIDTHVHYPQVDVIASPAAGLLDWLERYTFPEEQRFADTGYASTTAAFFLDELARNGTTTAMVFGTVHSQSVDAFMLQAQARHMRMICGKCLMDREAPAVLRDTAESGYRDSKALIERWHGQQRLGYAITPRFAASSTPEQLALAGKLAREHPDVWVQTHVAENMDEIALVRKLYPEARSYLDVYDRAELLRERTMLAHGIWLDSVDRSRLAHSGAAIAHCPTSNLFLGSGLFRLAQARDAGVRVCLGTDVGGGDSFSMLRTLAAAHQVAQLCEDIGAPGAFELLHLGTRAGALALGLADRIGSLQTGMEADFILLDPNATPLLARRTGVAPSLEELLFALITLGDDRAVAQTVIAGTPTR